MLKRQRIAFSIKNELIKKSQESALAAIQIFNNSLINFKAETFIVLMVIAWTYLLHAYYKREGIDYRYFDTVGKRKKYLRTKYGAYKHWDLERCLADKNCPLDAVVQNNLQFLIGIRHEIEHQMTNRIDNYISAKFQACCINYNGAIKQLIGEKYGLDKTIPIALQLFSFGEQQIDQLKNKPNLPKNLIDFVADFEDGFELISDPRYSYRVIYIRDNVNHPNQADSAYTFVNENFQEGKKIQEVLIKRVSHKEISERDLVKKIKAMGYQKFSETAHRNFWKTRWSTAQIRNSCSEAGRYGKIFYKTMWIWFEDTWLPEVKKYCEANKERYINP